jgi:adenylate kinase
MFNFGIIFVSGVHGVGKGYLCSQINNEINLPTFSASALIKSIKNKEIDFNKKVVDLDDNQDHLIKAISCLNVDSKHIILDGHFCLFDGEKVIEISADIFESLPIEAIITMTDLPEKIHNRLQSRDGKSLPISVIEQLQDEEIVHSKFIAQHLNVPYYSCSFGEYNNAIRWISKMILLTSD